VWRSVVWCVCVVCVCGVVWCVVCVWRSVCVCVGVWGGLFLPNYMSESLHSIILGSKSNSCRNSIKIIMYTVSD